MSLALNPDEIAQKLYRYEQIHQPIASPADVIPASHLAGPKPHYHDPDCQLSDEDVRVEQDVVVPLSPGGVLFFSSLLHHGTPPNYSAARRHAIQLHYCSIACESIDGDRHLQMFQNGSGYAGCLHHANGLKTRPIVEKPAKI